MSIHIVFSDRHCKPGSDQRVSDWIGRLILDVKPDVVVDNGDGFDFESLCVAPTTKILTAEMKWKEAGSLIIGEEILGFDEEPVGLSSAGKLRKFKKAFVTQNTRFISKEGYHIKTTHGDVICSKDHTFLAYNKTKAYKKFYDCSKIQTGWKIMSLGASFHSFETEHSLTDKEIGYLQGFFDGEGYYGDGRLSWSQNDGVVADYVRHLVEKMGFSVSFYKEESRPKLKHYYIKGSYLLSWKLLHTVRPLRLLKTFLSDIDGKTCSKFAGLEDAEVISVEKLSNVEVIGLETTSKTYISNSLFSHNCSYDRNTRAFQGRNYGNDISTGVEGFDRIWSPIRRAKRKMPRRVFTWGNHEHRLVKALNLSPELEGAIAPSDLQAEHYYTDVVPYEGSTPGVIEIDGIYYAHFLVSGIMGRPIGGEQPAYSLIAKQGASCTVGHSHLLDFSRRVGVDGRTRLGLVSGTASLSNPSFAGLSSRLWWQGVVIKYNVEDGNYNPRFVSLSELEREYA